jgi:hypothetical protein
MYTESMKILLYQQFVRCDVTLLWAGSSAWLERSTDNRKVAGSNPARPTTNSQQIQEA